MDLAQLANLGEFIGGVAVLVTLVYLSLQVRQHHQQTAFLAEQIRQDANAATSNAMNSWLSDYNQLVIEIAKDPELALLYRRGLSDFEALSSNDQMRFHAWAVSHTLNAQTVFFQLKESTMHPEIAGAVLNFNAAMLKTKGGGRWWELGRDIWRPEFLAHMEGLIDEAISVGDTWPWFLAEAKELGP